MKRVGLLLLILAVAALLMAVCGPARAWTIRADHPRFLIADSLAVLQARWVDPSPQPTAYQTWYARAYQEATLNSQWGDNSWGMVAFAAALSENTVLRDSLRAKIKRIVPGLGQANSRWIVQCNTVFGRHDMLIAYDWGYSVLDARSKYVMKNRAYKVVKASVEAVPPAWPSVVHPHEPAFAIPFIFAGDYDLGGAIDTNQYMVDAAALYLSKIEAFSGCFDQVYGPSGGADYYPGFYSAFAVTLLDLIRTSLVGYSGPALSGAWQDGIAGYWLHWMRSDEAAIRYRGRFNQSDTTDPLRWGPWAENRNQTPWCWSIVDQVSRMHPVNDFNDSSWGRNLTNVIMFHNPAPGAAPVNDEPRVYVNNVSGRYSWRDSWSVFPSTDATEVPASSQIAIIGAGPSVSYEPYRWSGSFLLRRGVDDLIYPRGKWHSSDDQYNRIFIGSTTGSNGLHIQDPTENLGAGWTNDGGQIDPPSATWAQFYPGCSSDSRYAGHSDSLPADASQELGVVAHLGGCYGSKADSVSRGFRVPMVGFFLVQSYAALTDTFDTWEGFGCLSRPVMAGTPTWSTLRGRYATGGIFETATLPEHYDLAGGLPLSSCYVHPAYTSAAAVARVVGGTSAAGLSWRQYLTQGLVNSVADSSGQSYDSWMGTAEAGINRPSTYSSLTQAYIDNRNSYFSQPEHKALDWAVQTYTPDASGTYRSLHLIEWGAAGSAARTVTTTTNGGGWDLAITPGPLVFIHEPPLSDTGYVGGLQALTIDVPAAGECRLWGFSPGNYTVAQSGVDTLLVAAPNGGLAFYAPSSGTWLISLGSSATGRCCYADGTCAMTTQAACTGTWAADSTCADPCPQPTGACCCPNGTCSVRVEATCISSLACGGPAFVPTWAIFGVCDPNPCPQPLGRCCYPDGTCAVTLQADCSGTWSYSLAPTCTPNPCTQPQAACCFGDGSCFYRRLTQCNTLGGTWLGYPTTCDPNPCAAPDPTGSCCALNGTCAVTLAGECDSPSVWTEGGVCDPNPCTQPDGACCDPDGTCALVTAAECAETWMGPGTVCSPNPCEQPTGSCCAPEGTCTVTLLLDCSETWTMFGICTPNPCAQPSGACCDPDGSCTVATQAACGGAWLGYGSDCDPDPCPDPPAEGACCRADGSCTVTVEASCDGTWHDGWGCTPNPCPRSQLWRPINPWDDWSWWWE